MKCHLPCTLMIAAHNLPFTYYTPWCWIIMRREGLLEGHTLLNIDLLLRSRQ